MPHARPTPSHVQTRDLPQTAAYDRPARPGIPARARWAGLLLSGALALLAGGVHTLAQNPQDGPAGATKAADERQPFSAPIYAAQMITRLTLLDLRLQENPQPRDYEIAALALEAAQTFDTTDADLVRRRIECLWNAGDEAGSIELTRRLVELDKSDTVAQLRLLSANIAKAQTVDARRDLYARVLGPEGARIDPSVRSRLAVDAALLARDSGDEDGFVQFLKQATSLDVSNKEAATLASAYYSSMTDDPAGRLELTLNLILTDPLDPNLFMSASTQAASAGAMKAARRLHDIALRIMAATGQQLSLEEELERQMLAWHSQGADPVREQLNRDLRAQRENAARSAERARRALVPEDQIVKPEDVRLPSSFETIRAYASVALKDDLGLEESLADFTASVDALIKEAADPASRPEDLTEEQAARVIARVRADASLVRAICGRGLELVEPALAQLPQEFTSVDDRADAARGWLLLHAKKYDEAIAAFDTLLENTSRPGSQELGPGRIASMLGRGRALWLKGDEPAALDAYRALIRAAPLNTTTGLAVTWLSELAGRSDSNALGGEAAARIERLVDAMPKWIDEAALRPRAFLNVRLRPVTGALRGLERPLLELAIANVSSIPLAVGSNRPINSRFIVSPRIEVGALPAQRQGQPEIVEIDRRLRLMPGEEITVRFWPDIGYSGWFTDVMCALPMRVRYRAIQGFIPGDDEVMYPSPGGAQLDTTPINRPSLPEMQSAASDLARRASTASGPGLAVLAVAARAKVLSGGVAANPITPEDTAALAQAFADVYPKSAPADRAIMLSILPHARQSAPFSAFDTATAADADPMLLRLAMLSRAGTSDDALITAGLASQDPGTRRLAELLQTRLGEPLTLALAKSGPNLDQILPPAARAAEVLGLPQQ